MTRTTRSLSALMLLTLSACTFSFNVGTTTEPADIALDDLEDEVVQRPDELDGGDEDIVVDDGTVIIDEGSEYTVTVEVADHPRSSTQEDPS
ncbi:hypothetical protein [uncultured Aeromicrobium sp.]|uniref:hypothetical protein n=1 Tax=uncultured Aeromicrobium sp. TaxID=337820 RepID=UPI0025E53846|nr:hypothetical protein [uncultured Aeromicrobium sp.]